MKFLFCIFFIFYFCNVATAQYIQVDGNTYTPQQLIEDILINNDCIQNIVITNVVGGNFDDGDKSYGYFESNGSDFPFARGLVMSTGRLSNVPGPNNSLSDDNAPGWLGDADLETALGINNTTNATIIEFNFIPNADNIRFRYLFASEEYQENNQNTCIFSDAFAFLIKPIGGSYINIALVPGTNTPVQVTTVHSGIPGACPPVNENYFGSWNGVNTPINFNGQTKILIAETSVIPNQEYHIKLVIADEQNFRYDSAVFLEAESFNIGADLGLDRIFATNNPLCDGENYTLDATPSGTNPLGYTWYKNGILIDGETNAILVINTPGLYKVKIDYGAGCIAMDEILIEYASSVNVQNAILFQCEETITGIATFNLFDASDEITNGDSSLQIQSFFKSLAAAENNTNAITNPNAYTNSTVNEIVFARVITQSNCYAIAQVKLKTTDNTLNPVDLTACSFSTTPFFALFDLTEATTILTNEISGAIQVSYHLSMEEALQALNPLNINFANTLPNFQIIYARISNNQGCFGIAQINLQVIASPLLEGPDSETYCLNTFPEKITLSSGLIGNPLNFSFLWTTGATTPNIQINEAGIYSVIVSSTQIFNGQTHTCSSSKTITVNTSEAAQISYILEGNLGNQTIIVEAMGSGNYLYALDNVNGPFQESPIFENLRGGVHTIYVLDTKGCGIVSKKAYLIDFPNFFTPNNDGIHDYWQISGLDFKNLQIERVEIFDRYGKILHVLKLKSKGWDGTYRGKPQLTSDYWFKATFKDGTFYKGHFTLKR